MILCRCLRNSLWKKDNAVKVFDSLKENFSMYGLVVIMYFLLCNKNFWFDFDDE